MRVHAIDNRIVYNHVGGVRRPYVGAVQDTVSFNKSMLSRGKETAVVAFKGLQDPIKPALQMRVTGVTNHQENKFPLPNELQRNKTTNINELAESNWKDGQELGFKIQPGFSSHDDKIILFNPEIGEIFGEIGRVPDEVSPLISSVVKKDAANFEFRLSNIIAGTTKGASTIGLRVNLVYNGKNPEVAKVFDEVLNSEECKEKVFLYQDPASPMEVMSTILKYERQNHGSKAANAMKEVVVNIVEELESPKNKNILLVGHCKPDGDTIGCVLGLKNALDLKCPDKNVVCAVDDKIPGLFRHKLPGISDVMKRPAPQELFDHLYEQLAQLEAKEQTPAVRNQIDILNSEIETLKDPKNVLDPEQKFDLVVMMDVPTPKRFTHRFKDQIEGADKVIYIDHHPHRIQEWEAAKNSTGVDMQKVHSDKLDWIAELVPAATQQVAIIGSMLLPELNSISAAKLTQSQKEKLDAFVASTVTGMATDTGAFTRTANMLPQHIEVPVQERPNFKPEGLAKWLMNLTPDSINKKWLREEITYDISDARPKDMNMSAREVMIDVSLSNRLIREDLGLGIIGATYDEMKEVFELAQESDPETTLLDVQNAFKYSEVMGTLRADPALSGGKSAELTINDIPLNYKSPYDTSRIAVLVCQDKKAGELDEKLNIASQNSLRLSFRSAEGTIWAELLANLFNGGGHGGAAGAAINLPGVEIDTRLAVKIDGEIEDDPAVILETLKENYDINNGKLLGDPAVIEIVKSEDGDTVSQIIQDVVAEIRKDETTTSKAASEKKIFYISIAKKVPSNWR